MLDRIRLVDTASSVNPSQNIGNGGLRACGSPLGLGTSPPRDIGRDAGEATRTDGGAGQEEVGMDNETE
eukprot:9484011-Pyramimonas_sp.AAC.1